VPLGVNYIYITQTKACSLSLFTYACLSTNKFRTTIFIGSAFHLYFFIAFTYMYRGRVNPGLPIGCHKNTHTHTHRDTKETRIVPFYSCMLLFHIYIYIMRGHTFSTTSPPNRYPAPRGLKPHPSISAQSSYMLTDNGRDHGDLDTITFWIGPHEITHGAVVRNFLLSVNDANLFDNPIGIIMVKVKSCIYIYIYRNRC
jgi:hypothetical protein